MLKNIKDVKELDSESETGSMLIKRYESYPRNRNGRRRRNILNFRRYMQLIAEELDESDYEEEEKKTSFRLILEDPEKLDMIHNFFEMDECEQERIVKQINHLDFESHIDIEPSYMMEDVDCGFTYIVSSHDHRSGLSRLSKKQAHFLQRQHPLEKFQFLEEELRLYFSQNGDANWQQQNFSGYERYITHIIAEYLGLCSESFNQSNKVRVVRVFNRGRYFKPPTYFLYQEMANKNVI